ncbi:MAG TPA: RDD family protein [Solirubrobacterales bacterium]|nr:RDD family protein [Solirubrobacterales bacterium]
MADEPTRSAPRPRRASLAARVLGGGGRGARALAEASGIDDAIDRATEEAIVRALESPAVERAIARVVERATEEGTVERVLESPALERALTQALDSELVDRLWERLLASDETQKLVERIAEAPEVRSAIAMQGVGVVEDLGRQIGRVAGRLDDAAERVVRLLLRRPRRERPTDHVGLLTRALAFAFDAAIINLAFVGTAAVVALIFGTGDGASAEVLLAGAGAWILGIGAYLIFFWTLAGQTPGMRLFGIRIDPGPGAGSLSFRRAFRRLVGFGLSILPAGLGLAAVLVSDERRGWLDRIADTDVVRDDRRLRDPWISWDEPG